MSQQFRTVTTNAGRNAVREALAQVKTVKLSHMSVGDGGGSPVTPTSSMTALVNERFRAQINDIVLDPDTPDLFTAELFIPQAEGGWYIREVGLWMDESLLVMLRERRKGPERVDATEITLAEDPLFAIERRIEEEGDDGEKRLTSRIEYVFFSYEEAETYLEQFKYRLHGCRLTVLPTFGSLKRVLRAGEFLDEIERRLAEGGHDGAA